MPEAYKVGLSGTLWAFVKLRKYWLRESSFGTGLWNASVQLHSLFSVFWSARIGRTKYWTNVTDSVCVHSNGTILASGRAHWSQFLQAYFQENVITEYVIGVSSIQAALDVRFFNSSVTRALFQLIPCKEQSFIYLLMLVADLFLEKLLFLAIVA